MRIFFFNIYVREEKIKPPEEKKKKRYYERYLSLRQREGSGGIWESSKWKSQGSAFDAYKILEEKTAFHSTRFSAAMFVSHTVKVIVL